MMGTVAADRAGIYFFYDLQGVADEYVFYFLRDIRKHLSTLYIVCNGPLAPDSRERMLELTPHLIVRENRDFDVGAYRAALDQIGFERLGDYDELLLMNSTIYGPLFPFAEMFETMEAQELDFWGITSHAGVEENPFPQNGLKVLPRHIQSHFMAVRRKMLRSPAFKAYWVTRPAIQSYEDSVAHHECLFTQHFEQLGFRWATYTRTEELEHISPQPVITMPMELVRDFRCPIIKRRSFFQDYGSLIHDTNGDPARQLLDYMRSNLDYPIDLIWDNLLRTRNHNELRRCLQLNYILPDQTELSGRAPKLRTALWIHIYYVDMAEQCALYAASMPDGADVLITTDSEEKREGIQAAFSMLKNPVKVVLIENRGRDNSALLVGCAPYWQEYDVVCFMHDKKVRHLAYEMYGRTFSRRCYENTLKSEQFVCNVLHTFEENPRLGLLCPPPPNTSAYYNTIGVSDWGPNYENTEALHRRLGLTVPISREVEPAAPFGSVFWFRTKALRRLFEFGWRYQDFPEEPVDFDGTLLHAIERIYPFVAQQEGYYTGWLLSSSFAALELTNYHYMLRELNKRLIPACCSEDFHKLRTGIENLMPRQNKCYQWIKNYLKEHLPGPMFRFLQKIKKRLAGAA